VDTTADRPAPPRAETAAPSFLEEKLGLSLLANHFPPLHGLRVIAILSVVQMHIGTEMYVHRLIPSLTGWFGVSQNVWFGMDLFFILSGFLIGNILFASLESEGKISIGRFYARRSFRILPAYYAALTLFAVIPTSRTSTSTSPTTSTCARR
jgi:peptidoglycan/LPS O-acetylase OafA/YrhL